MLEKVVGVIGGSGLYEMEGLEQVQTISLKTPFGDPSDSYVVGRLEGVKVAFLPRHGKGHRIQPSSLNFRANIYGMKMLGARMDHRRQCSGIDERINPSRRHGYSGSIH